MLHADPVFTKKVVGLYSTVPAGVGLQGDNIIFTGHYQDNATADGVLLRANPSTLAAAHIFWTRYGPTGLNLPLYSFKDWEKSQLAACSYV